MESSAIHDNVPTFEIAETQTVKRLPIELEQYIIAFLDNEQDAGTIANCALICRRWLPLGLFKLYFVVALRWRRQWVAFERLMSPLASSSIIRYLGLIRKLRITGGWYLQVELHLQPWQHLVINRCAGHLAGLTCIELSKLDLSHPYAWVADLSGLRRSLTILVLRQCTFSDGLQLHSFVTAFDALSDLTLIDVAFHTILLQQIPDYKGEHAPLARLELNGEGDSIAQVVQWLVRSQPIRGLVYLKWWHNGALHVQRVWKLVSKAINSPSLQQVTLYIHHFHRVDLSQMTYFRILELHYKNLRHDQYFNSINSVLSSISSSRLEELRIRCILNNTPHSLDFVLDELVHLRDIDRIIARPQFGLLRLLYSSMGMFPSTQKK